MENIDYKQLPMIGDLAPDFEATTTIGKIRFSDFIRGNWIVFFSHPADFTPVCTSEMIAFAKNETEFEKLGTKLIGLSIDSIHSHIAWINNIYKNQNVLLRFPIIADADMSVSKLYGMIHPNACNSAAIRSVFFIDPDGKIRLSMNYPLNVGRNVDEILRVLQALQLAEKCHVSIPENWKMGDKVIVSPPKTVDELLERENTKDEKIDFYFVKKSIV